MDKTEYRAGVQTKQAHSFSTRVIDMERRIVEFVGSTETTDRYNTRLIGWNTKDFEDNPVFLWAHSYEDLPIGRVEEVRTDKNNNLVFRVQYAPRQIHPFAGTVFDLVAEGFINAVSVGFIPGKIETAEDGVTELLDNDLLELSQVPVPANPEALANAMGRGLVPEGHKDFFVANRSVEIRELDGMDINSLAEQVREWVTSSAQLDDTGDIRESDGITDDELVVFALKAQLALRDTELEAATECLEARDAQLEEAVNRIAELEQKEVDDVTATGALILIGRDLGVTLDATGYRGFVDEVKEVCSRAGASLSRSSTKSLEKAISNIQTVLDASQEPVETDNAHGSGEDKKKKKKSVEDERLEQLERRLETLTERVAETDHNAAAQELISGKRGASDSILDSALSRLSKRLETN